MFTSRSLRPVALGLGRVAVIGAVPLPTFTAYLDVFAHVAEVDPIGFLASVMVTDRLTPLLEPAKRVCYVSNTFVVAPEIVVEVAGETDSA